MTCQKDLKTHFALCHDWVLKKQYLCNQSLHVIKSSKETVPLATALTSSKNPAIMATCLGRDSVGTRVWEMPQLPLFIMTFLKGITDEESAHTMTTCSVKALEKQDHNRRNPIKRSQNLRRNLSDPSWAQSSSSHQTDSAA